MLATNRAQICVTMTTPKEISDHDLRRNIQASIRESVVHSVDNLHAVDSYQEVLKRRVDSGIWEAPAEGTESVESFNSNGRTPKRTPVANTLDSWMDELQGSKGSSYADVSGNGHSERTASALIHSGDRRDRDTGKDALVDSSKARVTQTSMLYQRVLAEQVRAEQMSRHCIRLQKRGRLEGRSREKHQQGQEMPSNSNSNSQRTPGWKPPAQDHHQGSESKRSRSPQAMHHHHHHRQSLSPSSPGSRARMNISAAANGLDPHASLRQVEEQFMLSPHFSQLTLDINHQREYTQKLKEAVFGMDDTEGNEAQGLRIEVDGDHAGAMALAASRIQQQELVRKRKILFLERQTQMFAVWLRDMLFMDSGDDQPVLPDWQVRETLDDNDNDNGNNGNVPKVTSD